MFTNDTRINEMFPCYQNTGRTLREKTNIKKMSNPVTVNHRAGHKPQYCFGLNKRRCNDHIADCHGVKIHLPDNSLTCPLSPPVI